MTTLAEKGRQYVLSNGGHAAVATSISVPANHLIEWVGGLRKASAPLAAAMGSLLGVRPSLILAEDTDQQFLAGRGRRP